MNNHTPVPGVAFRLAKFLWGLTLFSLIIVMPIVLSHMADLHDDLVMAWAFGIPVFYMVLVLLGFWVLGGWSDDYNSFLIDYVVLLPQTLHDLAEARKRQKLCEDSALINFEDSLSAEIEALVSSR